MKHCMVCGGDLPEKPLLQIKNLPASAQDIPDAAGVKTDHGITLSLYFCPHCGLVQLAEPPVSYYRDVIRTGGSSTMDHLRRSQYEKWFSLISMKGKKILEAGCGRGEYLKILADYPVRAFGLEHKKELAEKALDAGLKVYEGYPETEHTVFPGAPYDGFTSFNFLEHQPDPKKYLKAIWNNLTEDGSGVLSVPSFEYILEQNSYYEFIRDHLAYYTEGSLTYLLKRCGFRVLSMERVNRDTLSAVVQKVAGNNGQAEISGFSADTVTKTAAEKPEEAESISKPERVSEPESVSRTDGLDGMAAAFPAPDVSGLIRQKDVIEAEVLTLVKHAAEENRRIAVWGAGHQGFTLCAATGLLGRVSCIIDSAPFKQGRFAPASHIPILSPEDARKNPADVIIIVAPGYTDEIAGIIRKTYPAGTEIYTLKTDHLLPYESGKI